MKVVIIGGGASGMMASIIARKNGHEVTVIEHKDKIGKKLLATGNGRCNLTNDRLKEMPSECYKEYSSKWIDDAFNKFGYEETIEFFNKLGLLTKDRQGLIYPYSDQASAVLDALRFRMEELGVKVLTDCHIKRAQGNSDEGFLVHSDKNEKISCDRLIIATGSKAQPKLGADGSGYDIARSFGHSINFVHPGLVQLRSAKEYFKSIQGVRTSAECRLIIDNRLVAKEMGELQLTAYGLSGIVIMNLSNYLGRDFSDVKVSIDVMPEFTYDALIHTLSDKINAFGSRAASSLLIGILPKKLGDLFLKLSGIGYETLYKDIGNEKLAKLVNIIKEWEVPVSGTNSFEECQISLGGVPVDEVLDTMESKICKGLYFCGEVLDVHGKCGGYNLQLAWTTGNIAGRLQ